MTDRRWAVVDDGIVVNLIVWDGESPWSPPSDARVIEIPDDSPVDIGWSYDGSNFAPERAE